MLKIDKFSEYKNLSNRINTFLDKYATIRADWDEKYDEEDEKYASPDASILKY